MVDEKANGFYIHSGTSRNLKNNNGVIWKKDWNDGNVSPQSCPIKILFKLDDQYDKSSHTP